MIPARTKLAGVSAALVLLLAESCMAEPQVAAMALTLTSSAFKPQGHIPAKYTCEGDDLSPPLALAGVPRGTKSLALIIDDPDAPDPDGAEARLGALGASTTFHPTRRVLPRTPTRPACPRARTSGVNDSKQTGIWRAVPADRPAPLFPQALRARHHARARARRPRPSSRRRCKAMCWRKAELTSAPFSKGDR